MESPRTFLKSIHQWAFLLACTLLACTGCSDSPYVSASGTVKTVDGHPVQTGTIEFRHRATRQQFAANIKKSGGFTLMDLEGNPGALPGEYDVVVVQLILTEDLALKDHNHGATLPRHYADYYTSGLEYEIPDEGDTEIAISVELE